MLTNLQMLTSVFKTFSAESFTEICTDAIAAARQWEAEKVFSDPVCLEFLRTAHSDTLVQLTWWLHRVPEWLMLGSIPQVFLVQAPVPRRVKQEHIGQGFLQCILNVSRHETPKHVWANSSGFEQLTVNIFFPSVEVEFPTLQFLSTASYPLIEFYREKSECMSFTPCHPSLY